MREHLQPDRRSDRSNTTQTPPDPLDTWLLSNHLEQHIQQQSESQFLALAIVLVLFVAVAWGIAFLLLH